MTAPFNKQPAAIRVVIPFVFRHWGNQPARALAVAGGLLGATVADLFMPVFSGHLVDALTRGAAGGGFGRTTRQRVDQMAREHRHEQVGDGRPQQAAGDCKRQRRLMAPLAKDKRNDHAYRSGLLVD